MPAIRHSLPARGLLLYKHGAPYEAASPVGGASLCGRAPGPGCPERVPGRSGCGPGVPLAPLGLFRCLRGQVGGLPRLELGVLSLSKPQAPSGVRPRCVTLTPDTGPLPRHLHAIDSVGVGCRCESSSRLCLCEALSLERPPRGEACSPAPPPVPRAPTGLGSQGEACSLVPPPVPPAPRSPTGSAGSRGEACSPVPPPVPRAPTGSAGSGLDGSCRLSGRPWSLVEGGPGPPPSPAAVS